MMVGERVVKGEEEETCGVIGSCQGKLSCALDDLAFSHIGFFDK